jgi:dihydrolipoamide dehydrogenase
MLTEILPPVDTTITAKLKTELGRQGVTFLTEARLTEVAAAANGLVAKVEHNGSVRDLPAEYVLVAIGRRPLTDNLGLDTIGIEIERGRILVNEQFATSVPDIYAIGDCNGQTMLAHVASAQGVAAVEHALGHQSSYCAKVIPSCIYTSPEVASVGLTEQQAQAKGLAYKSGLFPLSANGKAVIEAGGVGLIKILASVADGKILGVHIMGPRATDLIAEAALALRLGARTADIEATIHAHPTISEAMPEAAMAVDGESLSWPPGMKVR